MEIETLPDICPCPSSRIDGALERVDMWLKEQGLDKAGVPSKSERPSLALCATVDASVEAAPATQAPPGEDGYKVGVLLTRLPSCLAFLPIL